MPKSYYLFNPMRMSRKDNTLQVSFLDETGETTNHKYIPVEDVSTLYAFGSLDVNSAVLNFLAKHQVCVHFFDYYEHYTGSFMPKEYLLAGKMQVAQTRHYLRKAKRLEIARKFVEGGAYNMRNNLRYYQNRGRENGALIADVERYAAQLAATTAIDELMGLEGNIRQTYYEGFGGIIRDFEMGNRSKQPPSNEVNALVSFGNMLCYTACLDAIHHTQLNPTISFLHEPGFRRYSLALDISEIFKPLLVDRLVFSMLNNRQLQENDFDTQLNGCVLKEKGRRAFVKAWDEKLKETIKHRSLNKSVSYKHLIKLECYKLVKHLMGMDEYKPFKMWW